MKFQKWISVFSLTSLAIAFSAQFSYAGNEARGTEDLVLMGLALKSKLSAKQLLAFDQRKQYIQYIIESEDLKSSLLQFEEKIKPSTFSSIMSPRSVNIYRRMLLSGLRNDILKSKFIVKNKCLDFKGEERAAATKTIHGADICFNAERITLLELVPGLAETKDRFHLVIAIALHELARHIKADDDQMFLFEIAKELKIIEKTSIENCSATSNACWLQNPADTYILGVDFYKSSRIRIKVEYPTITGERLTSCVQSTVASFQSSEMASSHLMNLMPDPSYRSAGLSISLDNMNSVVTGQVGHLMVYNSLDRQLSDPACPNMKITLYNSDFEPILSLDRQLSLGDTPIRLEKWLRLPAF